LAATAAVLPRHHAALVRTEIALASAIETIDPSAHALADPELTAAALRDALDALGQITGTMTPDDILARVFSTFCVGK
ncbi:MAG: tRNA uridine-5-carboxymethylaminomethyl(34) synthesis GTPase MnmE, partial [Planctomycetota bacterium]